MFNFSLTKILIALSYQEIDANLLPNMLPLFTSLILMKKSLPESTRFRVRG